MFTSSTPTPVRLAEPRVNAAAVAELNSLGYRTAQRIIASGNGPKVVQLGDRRIGITEAHNREWQASRVRERG